MYEIPAGYTVRATINFQSGGVRIDPTYPVYNVYGPSGTSLTSGALQKVSTGIYQAVLPTSGFVTGVHTVRANGTHQGSLLLSDAPYSFQVVPSLQHRIPLAGFEDVLRWIGSNNYKLGDEQDIATLLYMASDKIRHHTHRRFGERITETDERHILGQRFDADNFIVLKRAPVESFTALYCDADMFTDAREATSVVSFDYKVDLEAGAVSWHVKLAGTFYATYVSAELVPPSVEQVAKDLVKYWWQFRNTVGLSHEALSSYSWSRLPDPVGELLSSLDALIMPQVSGITI